MGVVIIYGWGLELCNGCALQCCPPLTLCNLILPTPLISMHRNFVSPPDSYALYDYYVLKFCPSLIIMY
jgi:hypothetical protein